MVMGRNQEMVVLDKLRDRICVMSNAMDQGVGVDDRLPILNEFIVIEILKELKVSFGQTVYEAEADVVRLANHLQCPVLDGNSNYCAYDITMGFILVKKLDPIEVRVHRGQSHIPLRVYKRSSFLAHIGLPSTMCHILVSFEAVTLFSEDILTNFVGKFCVSCKLTLTVSSCELYLIITKI